MTRAGVYHSFISSGEACGLPWLKPKKGLLPRIKRDTRSPPRLICGSSPAAMVDAAGPQPRAWRQRLRRLPPCPAETGVGSCGLFGLTC